MALLIITSLFLILNHTWANLIAEPINPGEYTTPTNTVPAFPVQTQAQLCRLDLSDELFGGVREACSHTLDRSRCCPVLAAWLFAAHARSALSITSSSSSSSVSPSPSPNPSQPSDPNLPMMPDDSQKCVNSLQTSLLGRNIRIAQPNASCDAVLCFCGIRLHQIASLSCPAAFTFNVSSSGNGHRNATPTAAVRNLERNCRNSSYSGCTKCLSALQHVRGGYGKKGESERAHKMFDRDCQLMGLTWLLARNKTAYIPTVSAVLRAIMYTAHPPHGHSSRCSPDQENMPLAVDSLQLDQSHSHSLSFTLLPLIILVSLFLCPGLFLG